MPLLLLDLFIPLDLLLVKELGLVEKLNFFQVIISLEVASFFRSSSHISHPSHPLLLIVFSKTEDLRSFWFFRMEKRGRGFLGHACGQRGLGPDFGENLALGFSGGNSLRPLEGLLGEKRLLWLAGIVVEVGIGEPEVEGVVGIIALRRRSIQVLNFGTIEIKARVRGIHFNNSLALNDSGFKNKLKGEKTNSALSQTHQFQSFVLSVDFCRFWKNVEFALPSPGRHLHALHHTLVDVAVQQAFVGECQEVYFRRPLDYCEGQQAPDALETLAPANHVHYFVVLHIHDQNRFLSFLQGVYDQQSLVIMEGLHSLDSPRNFQRSVAVERGVLIFYVKQQNLAFLGGQEQFLGRGHYSVH